MVNHPNRSKRTDISTKPITITLSGARWFALVADFANKPLSEQGRLECEAAMKEIGAALLGAAK